MGRTGSATREVEPQPHRLRHETTLASRLPLRNPEGTLLTVWPFQQAPLPIVHVRQLILLLLITGGLAIATRGAAASAGATGDDAPTAASKDSPAKPTTDETPAPDHDATVKDEPRARFLHPGEVLVFRLSWGIFSHAGELRIETTEENTTENGRRFRVHILTKSKGLISVFFPVDSVADSWIDPVTGLPLLVERSGREGDREAHASTVYDYKNHRVVHTDYNRPKKSGEAELPDEPAYDTFVVMMLARSWHLKVGESHRVLSSFEDDIYELEATAIDEDTIRVPAGKFDTVEIELKQLGDLKGFFKKGGKVHFFISKGEHPQIVRIELRAKAGTFVMQLEKIEEPPEETTGEPAAAPVH